MYSEGVQPGPRSPEHAHHPQNQPCAPPPVPPAPASGNCSPPSRLCARLLQSFLDVRSACGISCPSLASVLGAHPCHGLSPHPGPFHGGTHGVGTPQCAYPFVTSWAFVSFPFPGSHARCCPDQGVRAWARGCPETWPRGPMITLLRPFPSAAALFGVSAARRVRFLHFSPEPVLSVFSL